MSTKVVTDTRTVPSGMEAEEIAHLAGFFDGIGNVTVQVVESDSYRLNYTLRPTLQLTRADEDDPALGELLGYCEEMGVRFSTMERTNGSIKWEVKDPESIERFLDPMMDYLLTTLIDADVMMTEILPAIEAGDHLDKDGFYRLMGLVDQLREQQQVKYDQSFFSEKWSITK